jgi:hypothetical protein
MPDFNLIEGRISFTFSDADFAEKYDDWQHYRNVYQKACGSSQAVDFIVSTGRELWMIEVKDFRRHRRTKEISLHDEITKKVRDTMAGLISAQFNAANTSEVQYARSATSCTTLRIGVHLEQPRNPSRLFPHSVDLANFTIKLKQNLRFADCHPKVFNIATFPRNLGSAESI